MPTKKENVTVYLEEDAYAWLSQFDNKAKAISRAVEFVRAQDTEVSAAVINGDLKAVVCRLKHTPECSTTSANSSQGLTIAPDQNEKLLPALPNAPLPVGTRIVSQIQGPKDQLVDDPWRHMARQSTETIPVREKSREEVLTEHNDIATYTWMDEACEIWGTVNGLAAWYKQQEIDQERMESELKLMTDRFSAVERKQLEAEKELHKWIDANHTLEQKYAELLELIKGLGT